MFSDLPLRARCPPAYFCGVAFMPTPGGERGFALTHAPAHHLETGIYSSIMHNVLTMHSINGKLAQKSKTPQYSSRSSADSDTDASL